MRLRDRAALLCLFAFFCSVVGIVVCRARFRIHAQGTVCPPSAEVKIMDYAENVGPLQGAEYREIGIAISEISCILHAEDFWRPELDWSLPVLDISTCHYPRNRNEPRIYGISFPKEETKYESG